MRAGKQKMRTSASLMAIFTFLHLVGATVSNGRHGPALAPNGLKGAFLHITDIHPDPQYVSGTLESEACHAFRSQGRQVKGEDGDEDEDGTVAGYWGLPVSDCDSPMTLVNTTFDYLASTWADEVDFVVWTGDNARHDNDNRLPRTFPEIVRLNQIISDKMLATFRGVPVIPCIGNNDLYPHNIMFPGPSAVISTLQEIWHRFIPEEHYHTFARGGYFAKEVVTGSLIVVSLNTIYFFDSNKVVDGCPSGGDDPGSEQLDWLEVQLEMWRNRGLQVWMTGHVPPTPGNWYPKCYSRYGEIILSYQDTILGNLFGHMNVDIFTFIDEAEVAHHKRGSDRLTMLRKNKLQEDIHGDYRKLNESKKVRLDEYSIVHTVPSVIPTFNPSLRIWYYNTTLETAFVQDRGSSDIPDRPFDREEKVNREVSEDWGADQLALGSNDVEAQSRRHGHRHKKGDKPPKRPRHSSPESPSRQNRFLSPVSYTQLYIDLAKANEVGNATEPVWQIEYTTATKEGFRAPAGVPTGDVPTPWNLEDLTIPSWLNLAVHLAGDRHAWRNYVSRMFVSSGAEDM